MSGETGEGPTRVLGFLGVSDRSWTLDEINRTRSRGRHRFSSCSLTKTRGDNKTSCSIHTFFVPAFGESTN